MTTNQELKAWVDQVAELTQPDNVRWCSGSKAEYQELAGQMIESGDFIELNQETHPGCYLHRSDPLDVARVEHLTYICTSSKEDAGPNNLWMSPGPVTGRHGSGGSELRDACGNGGGGLLPQLWPLGL